MKKLLTAEEFYELNGFATSVTNKEDWVNLTKEFAKLHVQAAIETCIEEAPSGSSTDTVSYEDVERALKDCYPLDQIK